MFNDIQKNRYRVHSILSRLDDIEDEDRFADAVKNLAREGLISDDQYTKLMKKDVSLKLKNIADIIKTVT